MKIEIDIKNTENLGDYDLSKLTEIFSALLSSGGLTGVKNGKTVLHFDGDGNFRGVELDYWPWLKR